MKRQFTFYKYQQTLPNRWRVVEKIPYLPEDGIIGMYKEVVIKRFWRKSEAESFCNFLQQSEEM